MICYLMARNNGAPCMLHMTCCMACNTSTNRRVVDYRHIERELVGPNIVPYFHEDAVYFFCSNINILDVCVLLSALKCQNEANFDDGNEYGEPKVFSRRFFFFILAACRRWVLLNLHEQEINRSETTLRKIDLTLSFA